MEHVGAIYEGEWNASNGMCSEEADFMAQLLGNCSLPNEVQGCSNFVISSAYWPSHESNMHIAGVDERAMYSSGDTNTSIYSLSQGSSYSGGSSIFLPSSCHENFYPNIYHQIYTTDDYYMMEHENNSSRIHIVTTAATESDDFLNQDASNDSTESKENLPEDFPQCKNLQNDDIVSSSPPESRKRSRIPGEVQRNKRSMKSKKSQKLDNDEEDANSHNKKSRLHRQNSSSLWSEDESNASHKMNGVASSSSALNINVRTRASRGSATDPQSLYARKRRERINERLRILQNLVPNGTKVDISTMLEEAVQYVKFLQLQIKLLSSDDMWMYAPIAYNGMDMGLDSRFGTPKAQA